MNSLLAALFASAFVFIQCYISGTRMAFSLPAYALIALAGVVSVFGFRTASGAVSKACVWATVCLFAYIITRAMFSPVEYLARRDLYMVLACLVVYVLTIRHFGNARIRLAILTVMFALAVVEVLVGLWQFAQADEWMPFGLVRRASETRASGMFISSIHFAGYLEAIGPFALAIAGWGTRNKAAKLLCGCVAALCYFGVFISGSRGGWLSAVFSLVVFSAISIFVTYRTNKAKLPVLIYIGVVVVLAASAGIAALVSQSEMLSKRMNLVSQIGAVAEKQQTVDPYDVRIYNWQAAIDQWNCARLLGTGAGTHLYYGRQYRRPQIQSDPEHAHGDYLELLAEYGVVGAIGMALFLAAHMGIGAASFRRLVNTRREYLYLASPELAINIGALVALSAYLAHSVVDFNLHLPGNALLFAFIFGILATPNALRAEGEDSQPFQQGRFGIPEIILGALASTLFAFSILRIPSEYWCEKARIAGRDGRYEEAIASGKRALLTESKNPHIYFHLGQAYRMLAPSLRGLERQETLSQAVAAFRAGIEVFPQDENLWIRLGQSLDALGHFKDARSAYEQAISLDPKLGVLHAYFAKHLARVGREAEAEAEESIARTLGGKDAHDFFNAHLERPGHMSKKTK